MSSVSIIKVASNGEGFATSVIDDIAFFTITDGILIGKSNTSNVLKVGSSSTRIFNDLVTTNIVPDTSGNRKLGSDLKPFKDMHLSDTIYLGNVRISEINGSINKQKLVNDVWVDDGALGGNNNTFNSTTTINAAATTINFDVAVATRGVKTLFLDHVGNVWSGPTTRIEGLKRIVQVACSTTFSLAIDNKGVLYTLDNSNSPVILETGDIQSKTISSIACGSQHSLAIDSEGNVYTWDQQQPQPTKQQPKKEK